MYGEDIPVGCVGVDIGVAVDVGLILHHYYSCF